jgi:ectoine hydroxylase-related dioxygenase (phytanoyl-CoA dioxygenase family)
LCAILDQSGWQGVVEVVAEEGDVVLAHPLLFHASNPNRGTRPRVMAQPAFSMTEPKRTERDALYPVEVPWPAPARDLHPPVPRRAPGPLAVTA